MNWEEFKQKKMALLKKAIECGKVDKKIIKLLEFLNAQKGIVTTSSCSGRILLLKIKKNKKDAKKFFVWHDKVKEKEFLNILKKIKNKKLFWLRVEPFILHILTENIEDAKKILFAMKNAGIKRGGINYISQNSKKITIEVMGHGQIILPIYLGFNTSFLVKEINKMMNKNEKKLKKFEKVLKEIFRN